MELALSANGENVHIDLLGKKSVTLSRSDAWELAFLLIDQHSKGLESSDYEDFCAYLASRTKGCSGTASPDLRTADKPKSRK